MNYLQARKRESSGRWDYTCHNNRTGTYAIGYCRGWREATRQELIDKHGDHFGVMCFNEQEKMRPFIDSFHVDGHETEEEARACYKKYQLDQMMRIGKMSNQQNKCQICDAWTSGTVSVGGYTLYVLCPDHQGREHVESLFSVGSSIES